MTEPRSCLSPGSFTTVREFAPAAKLPHQRARRVETGWRMTIRSLALACFAVVLSMAPADAHHSFAMFDPDRTTTLAGTVKEFQWTNPHAWVILQVAGNHGRPARWAVEMNGTSGLARQGWRPKTLTPGMPITVTIHPLRDGTNAGQFLTLMLPDGTLMSSDSGPTAAARQNDEK